MRLFDTTFLVDLVNSDVGAANLAKKVDEENSLAALSVVSVHEYLFGVYFKYHGDNGRLKMKLTSAERDLSRFEILPLTQKIAKVSSKVHADLAKGGHLIGINDIYIAATALNYHIKLVTRNTAHFKRIKGLQIESY